MAPLVCPGQRTRTVFKVLNNSFTPEKGASVFCVICPDTKGDVFRLMHPPCGGIARLAEQHFSFNEKMIIFNEQKAFFNEKEAFFNEQKTLFNAKKPLFQTKKPWSPPPAGAVIYIIYSVGDRLPGLYLRYF